jgi:hypothetical protein
MAGLVVWLAVLWLTVFAQEHASWDQLDPAVFFLGLGVLLLEAPQAVAVLAFAREPDVITYALYALDNFGRANDDPAVAGLALTFFFRGGVRLHS